MRLSFIPKTNVEVTADNFQEQCCEYNFWNDCQQAAFNIVSGFVDAMQHGTINKFEFKLSVTNSFQTLPTKAAKHFDLIDIYQCNGYNNSTSILCDTNIDTDISILLPSPKLIKYIMDLIEMGSPEYPEHDLKILNYAMEKHNILILLS